MQLLTVLGGVLAAALVATSLWFALRCRLGWHDTAEAICHRWAGQSKKDKGKVGIEYECPRCGEIVARTTLMSSAHLRRQVGPQLPAARAASRIIRFALIERKPDDEQAS